MDLNATELFEIGREKIFFCLLFDNLFIAVDIMQPQSNAVNVNNSVNFKEINKSKPGLKNIFKFYLKSIFENSSIGNTAVSIDAYITKASRQ